MCGVVYVWVRERGGVVAVSVERRADVCRRKRQQWLGSGGGGGGRSVGVASCGGTSQPGKITRGVQECSSNVSGQREAIPE